MTCSRSSQRQADALYRSSISVLTVEAEPELMVYLYYRLQKQVRTKVSDTIMYQPKE